MKNNNPTLSQIKKHLNLIDDKDLSREQLQKLHDSGLFSDLLEAAKNDQIPEVNSYNLKKLRERFKMLLGIFLNKIIIKNTRICYETPIQSRSKSFIQFDEDIIEENFSQLKGRGTMIYDVTLVNLEELMTSEEAVKRIGCLGLRPGTPKELVDLAKYKKLNKKFKKCTQIIALGITWVNDENIEKIVQYNNGSDAMILADWGLKRNDSVWYIAFEN